MEQIRLTGPLRPFRMFSMGSLECSGGASSVVNRMPVQKLESGEKPLKPRRPLLTDDLLESLPVQLWQQVQPGQGL